ncbi:molybdopterin-guanine dinucleotide biosynthesis protein MobB [Thermodesulfovibrio hydrogeniphilus]
MKRLLSIGVGAGKSNAGKTTFIESLIKHIKQTKDSFVVAVKYSKSSLYSSIITEDTLLEKEGKDTARMKKAGADYVFWVKANEDDLPEICYQLYEQFNRIIPKDKQTILIIEGNSLVREMQTDVIIFLKGSLNEQMKPSGQAIFERADLIIGENYSMEEVMAEIEKIEPKKIIEKLLRERSNDGKITCAEARKIAEELNVEYIEVGRVANELKIKIRKCELGCF